MLLEMGQGIYLLVLLGIVAKERRLLAGVDREELLSRNDIDECIIEELPMVTV